MFDGHSDRNIFTNRITVPVVDSVDNRLVWNDFDWNKLAEIAVGKYGHKGPSKALEYFGE